MIFVLASITNSLFPEVDRERRLEIGGGLVTVASREGRDGCWWADLMAILAEATKLSGKDPVAVLLRTFGGVSHAPVCSCRGRRIQRY